MVNLTTATTQPPQSERCDPISFISGSDAIQFSAEGL